MVRCRAYDFAVTAEGVHIGHCTLPLGHESPWHEERNLFTGEVLAQWRGAAGHWVVPST